jgi:hypothetical protein
VNAAPAARKKQARRALLLRDGKPSRPVRPADVLDWPERESAIASLGSNALPQAAIERVDLIGGPELKFRRDADALRDPAASARRRIRSRPSHQRPRIGLAATHLARPPSLQ